MGCAESCGQKCQKCAYRGRVLRKGLLPRYWKFLFTGPEDSPELIPLMQELMDTTMILSPVPKDRRLPTRLIVKKVLRNTNMYTYGKFSVNRSKLRDIRRGMIEPAQIATEKGAQRLQAFRKQHFGGRETSRLLEKSLNEAYLWHGTAYEALGKIFSEDFRIGAKKRAFPAGFFGQGLYFAESCAKADEYATQAQHQRNWYTCKQPAGLREGAPVCGMILCRVVLGRVYNVNHSADWSQSVGVPGNGKYDSLIGARRNHRREFILYSEQTVFPEFAVLYDREYGEEPGGETPATPASRMYRGMLSLLRSSSSDSTGTPDQVKVPFKAHAA